jgi:hypothetical protein
MAYQVIVNQGGRMAALASTIDWRHDGRSFALHWKLSSPAIGDRSRETAGRITPQGLVPDPMPVTKAHVAGAAQPDAQVLLIALIEASALISANPAHYLIGNRISVPVMDGDGLPAFVMDFIVMDDDEFEGEGLFAGERLPILHLLHQRINEHDTHVELWLGRLLDYLPVRLLMVEPDGQRLDMTLQSADGRGL